MKTLRLWSKRKKEKSAWPGRSTKRQSPKQLGFYPKVVNKVHNPISHYRYHILRDLKVIRDKKIYENFEGGKGNLLLSAVNIPIPILYNQPSSFPFPIQTYFSKLGLKFGVGFVYLSCFWFWLDSVSVEWVQKVGWAMKSGWVKPKNK